MSTYSVSNIKTNDLHLHATFHFTQATASISGSYTQSLLNQQYIYTLTGNTTFYYTNPNVSTYNFLINAGTFSFTLGTGSLFKTIGMTSIAGTGSFVMACAYDGSTMWVSAVKNYITLI